MQELWYLSYSQTARHQELTSSRKIIVSRTKNKWQNQTFALGNNAGRKSSYATVLNMLSSYDDEITYYKSCKSCIFSA